MMKQSSQSHNRLAQHIDISSPSPKSRQPGRITTFLVGIVASILVLFYLATTVVALPSAQAAQGNLSKQASVVQTAAHTVPGRSVNGNPWGYSFTGHKLIYSPAGAFCSYFACIHNFWNGRGYVVECHDKQYSKSGGIRGACSYHRGVWRTLYRP